MVVIQFFAFIASSFRFTASVPQGKPDLYQYSLLPRHIPIADAFYPFGRHFLFPPGLVLPQLQSLTTDRTEAGL
jgi:hypothetical protein